MVVEIPIIYGQVGFDTAARWLWPYGISTINKRYVVDSKFFPPDESMMIFQPFPSPVPGGSHGFFGSFFFLVENKIGSERTGDNPLNFVYRSGM